MAQAKCITTAICELVSRGQPPKSTKRRPVHTEFVAALAGNVPQPIHSEADPEDLERRADQLEKMFAALHVYLTATLADSVQNVPGSTLDRLDHLFQKFSADALRVIRSAPAEMRVHENWRVS